MPAFRIVINENIVAWVPVSKMNPDNYKITKKDNPTGFNEPYLFECGSFVYEWNQNRTGGKIEIWEENGSKSPSLQLIKEIPLKPTDTTTQPISPIKPPKPEEEKKTETVISLGSFDPAKKSMGYNTYFRCSTPALFNDFLMLFHSSHNTTNDPDFSNLYCVKKGLGRAGGAFCWSCNYDKYIKGKDAIRIELTPRIGRWIGVILDGDKYLEGPEEMWNLPDDAVAIIIRERGQWQIVKKG